MFLDIHAHSGQRDIFIYAPHTNSEDIQMRVRSFPSLLDTMSPYFNFEGCKFGNEKYKKNCARLGIYRDFDLNHSFTIESSCWGYTDPQTDATLQFREIELLYFGKHLAESIARHFHILVSEQDKSSMFAGLDIQLDFALYEDERETKKKAKLLKKKGGKPLGGKLFKRQILMPDINQRQDKHHTDSNDIDSGPAPMTQSKDNSLAPEE